MRDECRMCNKGAKYRLQVNSGYCLTTVCSEHLAEGIEAYLKKGSEVRVWRVEPRCFFCDRLAEYEVSTTSCKPLYACEKHKRVTAEVLIEGTPTQVEFLLEAKHLGE